MLVYQAVITSVILTLSFILNVALKNWAFSTSILFINCFYWLVLLQAEAEYFAMIA